jgi:uncharacterized RDD family membrane protein YckC
MESGQGRDQPGFGPGSPGYGPGNDQPADEAQRGPQSPGPQSPGGPQSPAGPQAPAGAPPAIPAPESPVGSPQAPGYGGPVPPGGWAQQPMSSPQQQSIAMAPGELASWGSRLGAYLIDILILLVPTIVLVVIVVAAAAGSDAAGIVIGITGFLGYLTLALLYAPLLMKREGANNGQTWGKQVVGVRAVRDNGQPFTFGSAALREVVLKGLAVTIASSIIPIIPWFLNYFWPLWDDQNRALHDMVVSTHVVKS